MYTVYMHTTPSGKRYVGITCQKPANRWCGGKGYPTNKHFNNAISKYGWDNIQHEILFDNLDREDACRIEQLLIALFNTTDSRFGYNQTDGGNSGYHLPKEARKKIGDANRRRIFTEEILHNMSVCQLGKHHTEETKRKMSEAHKGVKFTEEHKEKISQARMGHEVSKETRDKLRKMHGKACRCIETDTVYASTWEAEEKTGVNQSQLGKVCNHKKGHYTAGGYHWEWASN